MQSCTPPTALDFNKSITIVPFNSHALQSVSRLEWFQNQEFSIGDKIQPVFAEITTYYGLAYSFNLLDVEDILNLDSYVLV